jgi:hypothetical protein
MTEIFASVVPSRRKLLVPAAPEPLRATFQACEIVEIVGWRRKWWDLAISRRTMTSLLQAHVLLARSEMVTTLIVQIVRFARPNIQIYDVRVVDHYQWVCARYRVGVRVQKQSKTQLSSGLDRISERITLAFPIDVQAVFDAQGWPLRSN